MKISGPQLIELKSAVVKSFNESNWRELAALTDTENEVENHPRLLRSLNWGDSDYDGVALVILRQMIDANDENAEIVKNYIQSKCEFGENISSENIPGKKIVFSPSIFTIPSSEVDQRLVSAMMPFQPQFNKVFDAIKDAAFAAGLSCQRADDIWDSSTVIQDIFSLIYRSHIVVCDFSGKNPNVFYEAGIAHTLGKHVIPITQSQDDVPFDLSHHRYAKYLNNNEGVADLQKELTTRMRTLSVKI